GRFMLAQAVQWLQRKWSHYQVEGMALPNKDALSEDSRLRRDQFLHGVGIKVEYEDPQHLKGRTVEITVGQLKAAWSNERLQRVE
ncbi:hypothetical protein SB759_37055, partial [Pseudomonas sp. SIMBA_059]